MPGQKPGVFYAKILANHQTYFCGKSSLFQSAGLWVIYIFNEKKYSSKTDTVKKKNIAIIKENKCFLYGGK